MEFFLPSAKRYISRYEDARSPAYLHPDSGAATRPLAQPSCHDRKRVLLVDDDPFFRSLMKVMLIQTGMVIGDIFEAEESATALAVCQHEELDIAFCDLYLTRRRSRSGIAVVSELRKLRPLLPIYMVTAENAEDVIKEVCSSGATGHILKPVNLRIVRRILEANFAAGPSYSPPGQARLPES